MLSYLAMMLWGASAKLEQVWSLADMALGLMTLVNIVAIVQLTPTIKRVTSDYHRQRKQGKAPEFCVAKVKIQGQTESGIWQQKSIDN